MLFRALALVLLAFFVALLSFGGIADGVAGIAQLLFFILLSLLVVSAVTTAYAGNRRSGAAGDQRPFD